MKMRWWWNLGRKAIFALALLATLLALFYAEENWRGARAWSACQSALAAQGESLDRAVFLGPPVPPERNLAAVPVFANWGPYTVEPGTGRPFFAREPQAEIFHDMPGAGSKMQRDSPETSRFELAAWQRYYRGRHPEATPLDPAAEVLRALEPFDPFLDELTAARAAVPTGQFRREYSLAHRDGSYASVSADRRVNFTLLLRATALLAANRAPEAMRDLETACWLRRAAYVQPPLVLPQMMGVALLMQDTIVIKNVLESGRLTADEITRLQRELEEVDLLADYAHAMRGERAQMLAILAVQPERGALPSPNEPWSERLIRLAFFAGPRGWIDQNKVTICGWYQDGPLRTCDAAAHRVYPERIAAAGRAVLYRHFWSLPPKYLAASWVYLLSAQHLIVAETQAQTDELVITCALLRYALAHDGHYPATLAELPPQFLARVPTSVFDGTPPSYGLRVDGGYELTIRRPKG